jgi:membrane protein DedA with SNARE-associated domain
MKTSAGRTTSKRSLVVVGVLLVVLVGLVAVLISLDGGDGFSLIQPRDSMSYLAVFLLVAADAVIPVFPGETTLNAASTLAAQGELELVWVIVAGALGAIVGDSTLFFLARRSAARVRPQLDRALRNDRVASAYAYLDRSAPVLLLVGRYVPGLRFVINTTMGLSDRRYRDFLPWSALGGALWSTYTCVLAYWVGSKLDEFPLASVVISGLITTTLMAAFYFAERRRTRRSTPATEPPVGAQPS